MSHDFIRKHYSTLTFYIHLSKIWIVNLNSFQTTLVSDVSVHWTTNYLPFSVEKIKLINKLSKAAGYTGLDQLQFYFPIIRFHSSWKELTTSRFTRKIDGMKHSLTFTKYLNDSVNLAKDFYITEEEAGITAAQKQILNELLDFCDENDLNVLFVSVPFALGKDHKFNKQLNYMGKLIQERGYPYLSLTKTVNEMGILPETDFYNNKHTNVHGSLKITEYMSRYLISQYGFTDKRGLPGWESWDKAAELYNDYISPYTLPFEREHAERNYDLTAPALNKLKTDGQTIIVSWKASEGADAYDIYRKSNTENEKNWAFVASTDAQTLQFTDNSLESEKRYTYTVVPKQLSSGTEYYGQFNFSGITGITK